ncbi:hypothetical protein ACJMK2_011588 [Sinanodonta woodiana]|uniref:Transmembrane protein 132E n=1 Tax=Sinanodonta woodiana TaxID=1069815 RepID=A0ABD3V5I3_SINWO
MSRRRRKLPPLVGWLFAIIGLVASLDISVENSHDVFFVKPSYDKNQLPDPNIRVETFFVNHLTEMYKIKASNGPFEVTKTIPQSLMDEVSFQGLNRTNALMHSNFTFNMDVSAHIVSLDISPKLPVLQVLIHTSPRKKKSKLWQENTSSHQSWCAQVYVRNGEEELTDVCILYEKDHACVVSIELPKKWWTQKGSLVNVSYTFLEAEQNPRCASASNSIVPGRTMTSSIDIENSKKLISNLIITLNEEQYYVWKDQDILLDVPMETFHPGDKFEVPIKLEAGSNLQVFIMRARVRHGLQLTGARLQDPFGAWVIHVDINDRHKTGTVTAFVKDGKIYKNPSEIEPIFSWQMEVDDDLYDIETGRIVWSIEYQRTGSVQEVYTSQESKIISRINIRSKDQERMVPILKVNELLNMAVLTGQDQIYPMRIYAINDAGTFRDVTHLTKCHSSEVDVLKVASDCSSIYVDGTESRGSHNVTIIAKSGRFTAFTYMRVWIPEDRMEIELSDSRLSHIRGWRVPSKDFRKNTAKVHSYQNSEWQSEKLLMQNCHLRLQQGLINLYTRFHIETPHEVQYFMGHKAYIKITDLMQNRLRMSDVRIATLNGNIIEGLGQGRTEIQVLSPRNGRVIAAKEIRVGSDKVSVEKMSIQLVSGLTLDIQPSQEIVGALTALAKVHSKLLSQYQEGVMDVDIHFTDGTTFPLRHVSPEDYFLEVTSLNHHVVGVAPYVTPYQPHIVATGEGSGELVKVVLKLGEQCLKKKTRSLSVSYLNIIADFTHKEEHEFEYTFQSDARFDTNRASDRLEKEDSKPVFNIKFPSAKSEVIENQKSISKETKDILEKSQLQNLPVSHAQSGEEVKIIEMAHKEPLKAGEMDGLSPLEVGMYVLLSVFLVAISVFLINCVVFMYRYKKKQKASRKKEILHEGSISNAKDWVWIGRATLERNAVNTHCAQTLMPEEDFNGNCTQPSSARSSAPSSNRNSTVSTYKGSECSIRITTNPLIVTQEGDVDETEQAIEIPQWDYQAMGMTYEELLSYFDNLKESTA